MIHTGYSRLLFALVALVLACAGAHAQSLLSLGEISIDGFPLVKAKFHAVDAGGNPITAIAPSDVVMKENGVARPVISVVCQPEAEPDPLSSVLMIDISGSMEGRNLPIAQAAARAWIYAMSLSQSECAVASFNHSAYLNQDFTGNRALLLDAADKLIAGGGTDYDEGLVSMPAGAVSVAKRGKYKRVVVFLTDGTGGGTVQNILPYAQQHNVRIYCVCVNMAAPEVLRTVSESTGGQWFEYVGSETEAVDIYRSILMTEQGPEPCEVTWQGSDDCTLFRNVQMELLPHSLADSEQYLLPTSSVRALSLQPPSLRFGGIAPPGVLEKDVVITAGQSPVRIDELRCSHPAFTVVSGGVSPGFVLGAGESRTVRVRFTPADSASVFATLDPVGDKCLGSKVYLTGGFPGVRPAVPSLKILAPNGGEIFGVGADTLITWEGVAPDDTLMLDYSIDNGQTWLPITDEATGLRHEWTVPNTPGDRCLARIRQFPYKEQPPVILTQYDAPVTSVNFSPDGSYVLGANDETAPLWRSDQSSTTAEKLFGVIGGMQRIVRSSAFSPDGALVAITGEYLGGGRIFDIASNQPVLSLSGHSEFVNYIEYSADGIMIATAGDDNMAVVWNAATGAVIKQLSGHNQPVNSARFNTDGTHVVTASNDNTARIWNVATGQVTAVLAGHTDHVRSADFSPDGTIVATASLDGSIRLWNAQSGALLDVLTAPAPVYDLDINPFGALLVAAYGDETVGIWNYELKQPVRTLAMNRGTVLSTRFGPDGNTIAAGALGGVAYVWRLGLVAVQEDISDAVWAIVASRLDAAHDLDMGTVFVGKSRDSLVTRFLCNTSSVPVRIDTMTIEGTHAGDFSLVSGLPPFVVPPHECVAVEFRFTPSAAGQRNALVRVVTHASDYVVRLTGRGVQTSVVLTDFIDFGRIPAGGERDTAVVIAIANPLDEIIAITAVRQEGPDKEQFTLLEPTLPFVIAPKSSDSLKVKFAPTRIGRTSGKIVFEHQIASQFFETHIFGEGICGAGDPGPGDSIRVSTVDAEGPSGTAVFIDVRVLIPPGRELSLPAEFDIVLRVNGTVLFPVGTTPKGVYDSGDRIITVRGVYNGEGNVLLRLQFMPAFGDDDTIDLAIESFMWRGCAVPTAVRNGRFVLTDICRAAGVRLFSPDGSLAMSSYPNPATERTTVEFDLRETGATTLDIVDVYGRPVARLLDGVKTKGSYSIPVDISLLPAGSYVLLLQTRTAALGAMIQVVQ